MIHVLWLCGPPGVGKTTVAWQLYQELNRSASAAFVDVDQLGICYPERAADPGRHRMKAHNVAAVAEGFRRVGARCLVVSGVVDAERGVELAGLPRAAVTVCRLRVGPDELRRRFLGRGGDPGLLDAVRREADALDASDFADVCVETGGVAVPEVVRLVRERTGGRPGSAPLAAVDAGEPPDVLGERRPADGPVLWLCGATGVGKSAVGFTVYQRVLRAGFTAAYVDLDQVGFCHPLPADDPGGHRVRARNLAALWRTYRSAGAQALVVTGPVGDPAGVGVYAEALPGAEFTLCRLHAGREELTRRIMRRGRGGGWPQPGDPLRGQPTERLLGVADEAVTTAVTLEDAGIGDLRIDTDGHTADQVADAILARTAWPSAAEPQAGPRARLGRRPSMPRPRHL
ncbi:AAA family ATPase [Streptomyces coeruleorubidus]|uniref:AAA family ATPase n=1 Tax=Streptomyces coeruleorubidus TaxID=116188 RepID=UPI00237F76D7|nr:AAA family ATPase [Streptomyces coeruleorubidus]WDV49616.1 AAA family ATPase [Streptomyces coeruleorubidus]